MVTNLERNKDGTVKGITTMGDFIKVEKPTNEQLERDKRKAEYEKQWNEKHPK